jgi:hypothetical protein
MRMLALVVLAVSLPTTPALLSVAPLQRLCYASSLSYVAIDQIPDKEYAGISRLRPTVQLEEPKTKSSVTIFESTDAGEEDVLICAFRGSANLQNFATNLRLSLVPLQGHPSARVHEGFQEAAQGLWALLEPELVRIDAMGRNRRAVFTGHSLGGATAQLCALAATEARVSELVTFAGPLIGIFGSREHIMQRRNSTIYATEARVRKLVTFAGPLIGLGFRALV